MRTSIILLAALFVTVSAVFGQLGKIKDSAKKEKPKKETAAAATATFKVGDMAECQSKDGKWNAVTIKEVGVGNRYRIQFQGASAASSSWVNASQLRPMEAASESSSESASGMTFKVGDKAEGYSDSDKKWYPIEILKVQGGKYFIHWAGYASSYDQFLNADQVRAKAGLDITDLKVGDKADVLGRSMWLEATILEINADRTMFKVKETVSGEIWSASANPVRIRPYTGPVVFNYNGKYFKKGQWIKVVYNGQDTLIAQVEDVKDQKFLVKYNGRELWYDFDAEEVRNDVRKAEMEAARVQHEAFFNECGRYMQSVAGMCAFYDPSLSLFFQSMPVVTRDQIPGIVKDLDELDAIIKRKYPGIKNVKQRLSVDEIELSKRPGTWREICEHRKELVLKFVEKDVTDQLAEMSDRLNTDFEAIKPHASESNVTYLFSSTLMWDIIEKNGKDSRPEFQTKVKVLSDNARLAGYNADAQIKQFWTLYDGMQAKAIARINQTAPAANSSGKYKDAAVEDFGKRVALNVHPGSTILRTAVQSSDWHVEVNAFGVPRYRTKRAEISWRLPSGRCVYTSYLFAQDYNGGSYGDPYIWGGSLGAGYQKCN